MRLIVLGASGRKTCPWRFRFGRPRSIAAARLSASATLNWRYSSTASMSISGSAQSPK